MTEGADISFVHLGISIQHMAKSFSIGGISFAYYGLIIGIGMVAGLLVAQSDAKRRGQNPDTYLDFAMYALIFSILGARIYYVIFQWGYYRNHLTEIINLRKGGLAIYGGIIAGILTLIVFTKKRKISFLSMADTACLGLLTGQIIGRWGNFVNCEAFGGLYGRPVRHETETQYCKRKHDFPGAFGASDHREWNRIHPGPSHLFV